MPPVAVSYTAERHRSAGLGPSAGLRVAAPILLAALASGCASAPLRPAPEPGAEAPAAAPEAAAGESTVPGAVPPWEIPPALLQSQRLYRVRYDGPEGEGGLRLTLWLAASERYRARAVDLLGRPLWSLSADPAGGLWIDHRADAYCRLRDAADLGALARLPLAPFPLASLPPLLLGRLPAPPAAGSGASVATPDGEIDYRDAEGRRWTATLEAAVDAGAPVSWALWEEGAGGPVLTWLTTGGEAVLSDRAAGVQLRWREVVAEPLARLPAPAEPPADYREVSCREAAGTAQGAPPPASADP